MPLKPTKRLPKRYNRPASAASKALAKKRHKRKTAFRKERWRRTERRLQQLLFAWSHAFKLWAAILVLVVAVGGAGFLLFSPILEVREIKVLRTDKRLDIEHVQEILSPLFGQHLLFLPSFQVKDLLSARLPDLHSITVRKEYPSLLSVQIVLDPLVARVHIDDPEGTERRSGTGALQIDYLTDDGVYMQYLAVDEENLPLLRLVDWGVRPLPGTPLVSPVVLEAIASLEKRLVQQFGHTVSERTLYLRADEVHFTLERYTVWIDLRGDMGQQIGRYRTFLENTDPGEVTQYIDVRISDRIIYR